MGINNWGGKQDPLASPNLSDWARDVALALNQSDIPVNERLPRWTGWRNISSSLVNGFTGTVLLGRSGWTVILAFQGVYRATAVTTPPVTVLGAMPAGFTCSWATYLTMAATNPYNPYSGNIVSGGVITGPADAATSCQVFSWPANTRLYYTFTFPTFDAWPTTLPGIPG